MSTVTSTLASRRLRFGERDGLLQDLAEVGLLDLKPHRPHEFQHLDDDRVGELRLADDVGEHRLRIGRVGHLPPEQAGHDLDAGERVFQLVRDAGRHLAERSEPIAESLALLELFDLGQVLEEHHRAERRAGAVLDLRQGVSDDAVEILNRARRCWADGSSRTRPRARG